MGICIGWSEQRCEGEQKTRRERGERERPRDVTVATANEGCREGRKEREVREGGIASQMMKQASHPVPRGQMLPSTHTE